MFRKSTLPNLVASAALALSFSAYSVADTGHHHQNKSFTSVSVTDSISMLSGKGGNVAVLTGEQGLLMVDDDYQDMTPALQNSLKNLGGEDKLAYIINTHWHGDHTQGNFHFGHKAPIIAHDNVRKRLLTSQEVKLFNMVTEPYPEHALPSVTYQKQMTLHINDEEVRLLHLADGHTDGDSVVFFRKSNVIHMGDHFFNGFFPFVDIQNGGSVKNMAANVSSIIEMIDDSTKVIPGHGALSNRAELIEFRDMLLGTYAEVKAMRDQGLSLEQMKKQGLSSQWDEWTDGFLSTPIWIGIVNASLEKD
jgi:glyoxylase-like metal-dependent hydrolase (beta-lactamase superfamily II)